MLIPEKVVKSGIVKCAATENTRYAISGVHLERRGKKCRAVVTDGHRLLLLDWSDKETLPEFPPIDGVDPSAVKGFSTIVAPEQWDAAKKALAKRPLKPVLANVVLEEQGVNDKVKLATTDCDNVWRNESATVEGNFPKYQDAVPDYKVGENAVEIGADPKLLREILHVLEKSACDEESRGVRLTIPIRPDRPLLITARTPTDGIEGTAVLMPMDLHSDWSGQHKNTLAGAMHARRACELIVKAWDPERWVNDNEMRAAYCLARDALEAAGVEFDPEAGRPVETDDQGEAAEAPEIAPAESEGVDTPPEPGNVPKPRETPGNVPKPRETPRNDGSDPIEGGSQPAEDKSAPATAQPKTVADQVESKRVTTKQLRKNPDKHAPVSGARCRTCGASAHRANFAANDSWQVINGAAYCPACDGLV